MECGIHKGIDYRNIHTILGKQKEFILGLVQKVSLS